MSQPSPLATAQQNARALRDAGDLAGARVMLDQTLEGAKAALGEDSPDVIATGQVLAGLHREAGDPMAARRVLEEAYAAGQLHLGDSHPLMLSISFDLGGVAEELGNRHEARRAFGRVATLAPAVFGDDHWTVRAAREYLGDSTPSVELTIPSDEPPPPPPMQFPSSAAFALPNPPPAPAYPQQPPAPAPAYNPPPVYNPPPAHNAPPAYGGDSEPTYLVTSPRKVRGATAAAMIAAAAAVLAAGFVAIQVVFSGGGDETPPPTTVTQGPRLAGDPPTELKLRVDGTAITVTWKDPTDGRVPFIIAGAQAGRQHKAMLNVDPGETSATINGLNPRLGYCFTVLAVYSTEEFATSGQVCTERKSPTPG
ncbi:fibronectin type III domain-containing protein [Phytohabitans houttuyneae]|uniref:fibronectin type III domain-containing protein n=1 Tax=Phytohabitans houttuyneae TaxID=1076126 RepID=UPI001FE319A8|nr:tetratricopeptide repeat protein [Phytohabitans houttuyneae]